jgi:hypothetical protein
MMKLNLSATSVPQAYAAARLDRGQRLSAEASN